MNTIIISLGGSVIVPGEIDTGFLRRFKEIVLGMGTTRFVIICGGGKICRQYQDAAKKIADMSSADLDWIGIRATRLNAEMVRATFGDRAYDRVIQDPYEAVDDRKQIIIGAGFEPGSSTDLRAVQVAERFGADRIINMSNREGRGYGPSPG